MITLQALASVLCHNYIGQDTLLSLLPTASLCYEVYIGLKREVVAIV